MVSEVAEENAGSRAGRHVWIIEAAKHTEMTIVGKNTKEAFISIEKLERFAWSSIKKIGGGGGGLCPERGRYVGTEQQGTNDNVYSMNQSFRFVALL